jgi:nucleoside-diphosphate-sugar epimerase
MSTPQKHVSILGCGWLGLPLAEHLIAEGYWVKGATTTPQKLHVMQDRDILPYLIRLDPQINEDYNPAFFDCHTLILNIPPSRRRENIEQFYPEQVDAVLQAARDSSLQNILFISSTSVYPNVNRKVSEEDAGGDLSSSGQAVLDAEGLLLEQDDFKVSIIRLCGLYDEERNPGRFLAGRQLSSNGKECINLIHREDCIRVIEAVLQQSAWGEIFNACSDVHPEKEAFYTLAARQLGLDAPVFNPAAAPSYKKIDSSKLKERLELRFKYPDPMRAVQEM